MTCGTYECIDAIWEAARGGYDAVGVRTLRFLRWRFPGAQFAIGSSRADGALLDLLIPALYPRGYVSISMRYLGPRWLIEALESRGFVPRLSGRMVSVGVRDGLDPEPFAGWYVTDADEDT